MILLEEKKKKTVCPKTAITKRQLPPPQSENKTKTTKTTKPEKKMKIGAMAVLGMVMYCSCCIMNDLKPGIIFGQLSEVCTVLIE